MENHLIAAAVTTNTGGVYCARNHMDAYHLAMDAEPEIRLSQTAECFITSRGEIVARAEGISFKGNFRDSYIKTELLDIKKAQEFAQKLRGHVGHIAPDGVTNKKTDMRAMRDLVGALNYGKDQENPYWID